MSDEPTLTRPTGVHVAAALQADRDLLNRLVRDVAQLKTDLKTALERLEKIQRTLNQPRP